VRILNLVPFVPTIGIKCRLPRMDYTTAPWRPKDADIVPRL
jgi:hypothetical protein